MKKKIEPAEDKNKNQKIIQNYMDNKKEKEDNNENIGNKYLDTIQFNEKKDDIKKKKDNDSVEKRNQVTNVLYFRLIDIYYLFFKKFSQLL